MNIKIRYVHQWETHKTRHQNHHFANSSLKLHTQYLERQREAEAEFDHASVECRYLESGSDMFQKARLST